MSAPPASRLRTSIACNIGAGFEWYDLVLYGLFAVVLAPQFFPSGNETISLTFSLGTFAVAYMVRPLGAMAIGSYADRHGRKSGLVLSAGLMMLGVLITAALPPYKTIGIAAPVLMVLARMLQGFSAGGEFGCATAVLAEQDSTRRGFYASLQWASSGFAVLLATLAAYAVNRFLTPDEVARWGWRLPFLFGLLIGPVAVYIRRDMDESPEFTGVKHHSPLLELARQDKRRILAGAGVVAAGAAGSYLNIYMPAFAYTKLHLSNSNALLGTVVAGVVNTTLPTVFGALSDRIGRVRVMATAGLLGMIIVYPLFLWLLASPTVATLIAIQAILNLIFYAAYYAPAPALLADLFPARNRTSGVSLSYVIAQLFFGGITPLVATGLVAATGNPAAAGFYIAGVALLSLLSLWACRTLGVR